ncbi:MAG: exopolysaccharide biosynthesis polyprenyl glycosylphosphotransferase [Schleiferiaceae bacterium]|nr:exopolysaccharide biosynthesis polyprenyl glycosylphosphotransferase [Schleiferiaceae bacterium]
MSVGRSSRVQQGLLLAGDLLWLNAAFLASGAWRFQEIQLRQTSYYDDYLQLLAFVNVLWVMLSLALSSYRLRSVLEPRRAAGRSLRVGLLHLLILSLLLVALKRDEYSRLFLIAFYGLTLFTTAAWHWLFRRALRRWYRRSGFRRAVLVGAPERLAPFLQTLRRRPELGLRVVHTFGPEAPDTQVPHGQEEALPAFLDSHPVQELLVAFPTGDPRWQQYFHLADARLLRFRALPDLGVQHSKSLQIDFYEDVPVLSFRREPLEYAHWRLLKRITDVLGASLFMLLLYPWLLPVLLLVVRLSGPGPLLFRQWRSGYQNQSFRILKLRTMRPNAEAHQAQAQPDDARITPAGRWLRQWHLDELPQFWLVFTGHMSLVGPRPHMLSHTERYRALIERYMVRHLVKPGITGLAQVQGLKGAHDLEHMRARVRADVYYLEHWSLLLDLRILATTLWQWLRGQ